YYIIMARYITNIHVNKLFHLSDFDIPVADDNAPHLILTGKNGSGKTITLNAIADLLDKIKEDVDLIYRDYPKWMRTLNDVNIEFSNGYSFIREYQEGNFIIVFYKAARKSEILEPISPVKPDLQEKVDSRKILTNELLFFLSDLKIQEALARNEQQNADADKIKDWFESFENVLKNFFEDKDLKLRFNYRDYTFHIETQGKSFKFTELSDGFSAIIDIIADLILKMQKKDTLVMDYLKPGIVLIDEIETHLHLQLQKTVLPLLTKLFPNIQFIVTTHSPFVLNSLPNATAFDMEHRETIVNLSDYSYQALTEGYFGVSSDSDYIKARLEQLRELLAKEQLTDEETETTKQIIADFRNMPEAVSPAITGRFNGLLVDYSFGENIKWNKQ
ncbi:MAG: AAA family ATPase, partial [Prevotella sp.]|nr:AAA family ATPase [Prevotella sp.]